MTWPMIQRGGLARMQLLAGVGLLLAFATSASAQVCDSDSDCDSAACIGNSDSACTTPECGAAEAPSGHCAPDLACMRDADCPEGTRCAGASACASEAGSSCAPEQGECVLALFDCAADTDCGSDEVCVAVLDDDDEDCDSPPPSLCLPGEDCSQPAPTSQSSCSDARRTVCFPARHDCETQADCAGKARCVAVPDAWEDSPPAGFGGAELVCLPEGAALAVQGEIQIDMAGAAADESKPSLMGQEPAAGCSVRPGQVQASAWMLLGLVSVALWWLRGRRHAG